MPMIEHLPVEIASHYFAADYLSVRSVGAHCKPIIDDFLEHYGLFAKANADFADSLEEFAALGFAWERGIMRSILRGIVPSIESAPAHTILAMYERAFSEALNEAERERRPREIIRPGETSIDGIYCTADGCNTRYRCGEEWKCSWSTAKSTDSLAALDQYHPDWMMQLPAYCHAHGWDSYILRAFHVNGYYEKSRMGKPVVHVMKLSWQEHEIEENWRLITAHRDLMVAEGRLSAESAASAGSAPSGAV